SPAPTPSNSAMCAEPAITAGAGTDGAGVYTYQWQQSTNNGVTWTNAPGASTSQNYMPSGLTQPTLFKRITYSNGVAATEGELATFQWNSGNVWIIGSSVKKHNTSPTGWGANAGSVITTQSITNNGGYIEAITETTKGAQMIGLGN